MPLLRSFQESILSIISSCKTRPTLLCLPVSRALSASSSRQCNFSPPPHVGGCRSRARQVVLVRVSVLLLPLPPALVMPVFSFVCFSQVRAVFAANSQATIFVAPYRVECKTKCKPKQDQSLFASGGNKISQPSVTVGHRWSPLVTAGNQNLFLLPKWTGIRLYQNLKQ